MNKYKYEANKLYYETFNKAIKGEIKSCFNCKHSKFHPPEDFFHGYYHEEAECTKESEMTHELHEEIEDKMMKHPNYIEIWEHYTALYCPYYEALTDEEREKRFKDYL